MYFNIITFMLLQIVLSEGTLIVNKNNSKLVVNENEENDKSSLVFVFDTTGSMHNDLKQLREGAEMILRTALEDSQVIEDFVFVPFHDPTVGPATVTRNREVFQSVLDAVQVYGGGDCPEKSLGGIQLALNVSRPRSFVYVFTDATASDHRYVGKVLDAVQRKQSQVVFVLTGHCNDLHKPHYKVYQQIAAASSGQVFNLNKTNVHKVLDFVRSSIRGRMVNLGSAVNKAGYNYTQGIPIDRSLTEVTVSVSGAKPTIKVVNPSGEQLTGPPKLITSLDLSEILVVKVLQPEPGNWTITTGSEEDYSVKVVGLSNLTFNHGFSVERPSNFSETSYRPLQGTYNHLMLSLSQVDRPVHIDFAEILTLEGKTLFEVPLHEVDSVKKIYLADPFVPPDEFFYIAINGRDEYNQDLRRIGATAVQVKPPDVPYLTVPRKIEARAHDSVELTCTVESMVPVTVSWTKDGRSVQPRVSSLQSTSIEYVINDMSEENVGLYRCVAKNVAGVSEAATEISLLVNPPVVSIKPDNITVEVGENVTLVCEVTSDALLLESQVASGDGSSSGHVTNIPLEPNVNGLYVFNTTIHVVNESNSGIYSCIAANRGGKTTKSTYIKVQTEPIAQIIGPHSITTLIHSDTQLVCHVENAYRLQWITQGNVVKDIEVAKAYNDMIDVVNVRDDGVWSCVAIRGKRNATDSVQITVLISPQVSIQGAKNMTILNGTTATVTCNIKAKPEPRILWHRETESFLNNTITVLQPNVYQSVLMLDTTKEDVNGTYFCFGENSEGIHQDSVTVRVRRKMTLIRGFTDQTIQLLSQTSLSCVIDSYPPPVMQWYHNNTIIELDDNMYLSENNNILYIQRVGFEHVGVYSCYADNGFEHLRVDGRLIVDGLESPIVSKEPVRRITQKGQSTILTCRIIKGNPAPTISWQYKTNTLEEFTALPRDVLINEDNSELIISRVETYHWGMYRCSAENVVGRDVYDVLLVVQFPPELINGTTSVDNFFEVQAGQRVQLSCQIVGYPPPLVTWTKDQHPISYSKNVYLSDASDLVIEKATERDAGLFACKATSTLGSLHRNFTVIVFVPPVISPPDIDPQIEVLEGDLVELACNAHGVPRPKVLWLHNDNPITEGRKYIDEFGLRFVANLTDFGEYKCLAENRYGNDSLTFFVYIWVAPYIESMHSSYDVNVGANTSIECNAIGFPIPTIFWVFQNKRLDENKTDIVFNDVGNLYIFNASAKHDGVYLCVAENIVGITKEPLYLSVNEPPKIIQDNYTGPYVATNRDTELVVSCRATGKPKPFIIWSKDDRYLDKDSRYDLDVDGTLTIKSPTEDLSGHYVCLAKNSVGIDNKTVSVQIYPLSERMQAEESQTSVTVVEGSNVTIGCPVHAAQTDNVKWYKDAKILSTGSLQINNISRENASSYACVVSRVVGSSYGVVTIVVEWGPKFDKAGGNVEAVRGEDAYFNCRTDAKPVAKIQWFFNSKPVLGQDKDRLKVMNVELRHIGTYKCVVSNLHGTITRQFTLDVLQPPFISEFDLLDVQLLEGANATLNCNARGSPTPTTKWTFNNTNWNLENSSLTTTNITSKSEGLYRCDAVNKAGAAYLVYRVNVVTPGKVNEVIVYREGSGDGETVIGEAEVAVDTHVRLSCKASGKPAPLIQWVHNGNTVARNRDDIGYADLIINRVSVAEKGPYFCVVSNEGGLDEVKIRLEVLEPPKIFQDLFGTKERPENVSRIEVKAGQAFSLHCHPYGNPMPEIYWFKDDLPLRFFDDTMISKDYGEVLESNEARLEQSGRYACVARNKIGNTTVLYLVDVLVPPPIPKERSRMIDIHKGKQLNLTCPVEGSPTPNVIWIRRPAVEMTNQMPRVQLLQNNFTLIINNIEVMDTNIYSCIMTNKVGTTEVVFEVVVGTPPAIAGNKGSDIVENHVVALRRSVILKCLVSGHPKPKVRWLKDTQQLSENISNIQRVVDDLLFVIWNVDVRDAGQYICVAENSAGATHRRYNVAVQVPGKWSSWSQWHYCNVTCGLGYQHRSRICQYIDDFNNTYDNTTRSDRIILDDSACKGSTKDRRKCHMPPCEDDESQPRWSAWSKWSSCSASCGVGTQARTRKCKTKALCVGDNVQIRKCPDLPQCALEPGQNPSVNDVLGKEDVETSAFIPEATFEMQPETVNTQYATDFEEVYIKTEPNHFEVFFEANVTDNLDRSYRGACAPGYTQHNDTGLCHDIDECLLDKNLCHSTQVCVNTAGAYRCTCTKGFVALGIGQRCLDLNECELDIHGCEFACVNTAGGYVCACPGHLRLHTDRHTCITPSYRKPQSHEDLGSDDYLSTNIEFDTSS